MKKIYNDTSGWILILPFFFSVYNGCELFTFFNIFPFLPIVTYHLLNFITGTVDTSIFVLAYRFMDLILAFGFTPSILIRLEYDNVFSYISASAYFILIVLMYSKIFGVLDSAYIHYISLVMYFSANISCYQNYDKCELCYR
mgnify:CR=1 FL=1|jgi:hypothetical protein